MKALILIASKSRGVYFFHEFFTFLIVLLLLVCLLIPEEVISELLAQQFEIPVFVGHAIEKIYGHLILYLHSDLISAHLILMHILMLFLTISHILVTNKYAVSTYLLLKLRIEVWSEEKRR